MEWSPRLRTSTLWNSGQNIPASVSVTETLLVIALFTEVALFKNKDCSKLIVIPKFESIMELIRRRCLLLSSFFIFLQLPFVTWTSN
jgi:hypothetical protein